MIFGRSPNLVLGFLTALFNSAVAFHFGGFNPDASQIATVNILLGTLVAIIANVPEIVVGAGVKAIARLNNGAPIGENPGTDLANKISNGDGIKVHNVAPHE